MIAVAAAVAAVTKQWHGHERMKRKENEKTENRKQNRIYLSSRFFVTSDGFVDEITHQQIAGTAWYDDAYHSKAHGHLHGGGCAGGGCVRGFVILRKMTQSREAFRPQLNSLFVHKIVWQFLT